MPKCGRRQERPEYEFMNVPAITCKDAPFGNAETPNITMKIVGSRHVPVIEKHPSHVNGHQQYMGSRVQPLQPIADKPNHLDPRTYGDSPAGGYYNDVQGYDNYSGQYDDEDEPTGLVNKRPDSKDVARNQYGPLPPIQANRHRNDYSTVFESESWTGNANPPLACATEYKQHYNPESEVNRITMYEPSPRKGIAVSDSERDNLYMLVPRNVLLPVDEIKLTKDQESTLCKLLCNDLEGFDPAVLRDIYIEASQKDPHLNGFCAFEHLDHVLRKRKMVLSIFMPTAYIGTDTMRLLASQYVNASMPGKVNYEKILSYVGSALETEKRGQVTAERPKYYQQNDSEYRTGSIYKDREVAKLLRTVEQELSKNTYSIDWNRWRNAFHMRDREHRETLSAEHIKDICYDLYLPLSDSLLNQILALCADNNKDGQYRWSQFLDFLGKVQCCNTGLPIPVSKRPLEYAKHYPAPVPNWPRAEGGRHGYRPEQVKDSPRQDEQRLQRSPRRESPRHDDQQKYEDRDRSSKIDATSAREQRSPYQNEDSMERLVMRSPRREEHQGFTSPHNGIKSQNEDELRNLMDGYSPVWRRSSPARERSLPPVNRANSVRQREQSPDRQYADYSPRNRNRISRGGWQKHVYNDDREHTPHIDYREPKRKRFADVSSPRNDRNSVGGYEPSWQEKSAQKHNHPPPAGRHNEDRKNPYTNRGYTPSWQEPQPRNHNSSPPPRHYEERDERYRDDNRVYAPPPYYSKREHTPIRRHQSMSPTRQRPSARYVLYDLYENDFLDFRHQMNGDRYNNDRAQGGGQPSYRSDEGNTSQRMTREEKIRNLTNQLNNLQAKYKMNKDSVNSRQQPWLDRYLKMADALYNCDVTNRGSLPMKDVMEIVRQYNQAFNLQLDEFKCNQVATDPANRDRSGNILLQSFLARLSV